VSAQRLTVRHLAPFSVWVENRVLFWLVTTNDEDMNIDDEGLLGCVEI